MSFPMRERGVHRYGAVEGDPTEGIEGETSKGEDSLLISFCLLEKIKMIGNYISVTTMILLIIDC